MSLFLHLTDLHLGSGDTAFDDVSSESIPFLERETRQRALKRALSQLRDQLESNDETLDAILLTGDITYKGGEDGFQMLEAFLSELNILPPKTRIAVIPGNHDVIQGTAPGSKARYSLFDKYLRKRGYITPLLDGVDFSGTRHSSWDYKRHCIIDHKNRWVVVPINTSNYCQMTERISPSFEKLWESFIESLPDNERSVAKNTLAGLRAQDMPRISNAQFEALGELLTTIDRIISQKGHDLNSYLRIALIHHQMLPVTVTEEVKKYESLTNLGLLRHFFTQRKFDLVLHGHKHIKNAYWDFSPEGEDINHPSHRFLVVSGGTLGERYNKTDEVCRLIRIGSLRNARSISIKPIAPIPPGTILPSGSGHTYLPWDTNVSSLSSVKTISGTDTATVYNRILSFFDANGPTRQYHNLVCHISRSDGAQCIPDSYPNLTVSTPEERQHWFNGMVDWWQFSTPTLSDFQQFTHGERIFGRSDQINNVTELLKTRRFSSRAVITLCRPEEDAANNPRKKFPSFCLAQFIVREREGRVPVLDCVGYFRKQEMKYWWPVNVAELSRLQKQVFDTVPKKKASEGLELGSITTISAIARIGNRPPQVAVSIVDRMFDQNKDRLWDMCYALFWGNRSQRTPFIPLWEQVLSELVPHGEFDSDGVPVAGEGLKYLAESIERLASIAPNKWSRGLVEALDRLVQDNLEFSKLQSSETATRSHYERWKAKVAVSVANIHAAVLPIIVKGRKALP